MLDINKFITEEQFLKLCLDNLIYTCQRKKLTYYSVINDLNSPIGLFIGMYTVKNIGQDSNAADATRFIDKLIGQRLTEISVEDGLIEPIFMDDGTVEYIPLKKVI